MEDNLAAVMSMVCLSVGRVDVCVSVITVKSLLVLAMSAIIFSYFSKY